MERKDIPKAYEAKAYEDEIYAAWEKSGFFNPDNLTGEPYTIMMPPPNVTGVLHLGHALENALMDTMARFQRMRGKRVLLVPGTDHAALPTQAKVEKLLMEEGVENPRREFGREKLVEKIRAFAEQSKATILSQVKKMGTSCDWSRLAYTFDETRNKAVNELFARMYNDGLIYRGYRVVNWSVKGQSTCSDDEVVYIEREAKLYTFKYAKDFPIAISSTRPETKLGDSAVAVHPSDERYQKFIGQTFVVDVGAAKPLEIKIIADENVDPSFGTGALGVTTAHSPIDFAMYEKQKAKNDPIGIIPVIGTDGKMTAEAGGYAGLSVEDAREKFVVWLKEQGLLEKEEDIVQSIGTSDRYGDIIESLPMTQWWLDMNKVIPGQGKTLRDLMREAVTTGLNGDATKCVSIVPEREVKLYLDRVNNLHDWCLSRQIWWGHRIPVWYRDSVVAGEAKQSQEMYVGATPPEGDGWQQDPDTLDTWFSSGSWTFSTLGWPEKTKDLETFHPTNWIQMGYEIRYLWLMRMILMSAYALGEIPFKDAYIHGILRDQQGKKFSKSSGNGIDPIEVIDQYGCDALRISLLIGISPGNDSRYYTEKIESGRNFTNKLWNIARFVLTQTENVTPGDAAPATLADEWILNRLAQVTHRVTEQLENYEFSQAGELLRDFTWSDFADWYLEIAKVQRESAHKENTERILLHVLKTLLKLWHPFMPFVTEVIWKEMGTDGMLLIESWPVVSSTRNDSA
ncbi:MAG: valine--tRNA ligase, partial [Patescibacteria group bacterium]